MSVHELLLDTIGPTCCTSESLSSDWALLRALMLSWHQVCSRMMDAPDAIVICRCALCPRLMMVSSSFLESRRQGGGGSLHKMRVVKKTNTFSTHSWYDGFTITVYEVCSAETMCHNISNIINIFKKKQVATVDTVWSKACTSENVAPARFTKCSEKWEIICGHWNVCA